MEAEHKSYLAERIILYPALLFISFIKNSMPVIFIFTFMWLIHYNIKIPSLLARISSYMVVMLPISSLCTSFFIVKTVVMHDRKMIKSKFLYFMKLFLNYYICLTIFSSLTIRIIIENNAFRAFQKLNDLTKFFLFFGIHYSAVLIFIVIFYLKDKECFRIQNMLIE